MSQHDFTIGNQLFPDTRTDLNNALVALASNSSGSAEPSTTYANQWWYETDTNTLKIRNEANSAWISVAVLDQTSNNVLSINTQGLTISNLTLSSTAVTATGAELNKLSGTSVTSGELDILSGANVTSAELNKLSGANVTTTELDILSGANVTTAELDILSGATVTTAELNKLSGANVTTAELNQLDDITRGSIIYGDSVGTARLAKGTDGQVLTATATDINWETPSVSDPAAIISSGGSSPTPSLATGITAGEVRTLIGAGVSDSDTTYSIQDGELSENNFTNADHTKLDGIETGATADQTNAEIRAAVDAATDSNVFTDADHSKLDGIAASANNYSHPNHSGEVTSSADGATVIADNVVDEANLKVSNAAVNGYVLTAQSANTGGLTWAAASSGGGGGLQSHQIFDASGTWTKPTGINKVVVYITDGGAGGGLVQGQDGATSISIIDVSSISTATITVGAGGAGSAFTNGASGGYSSWSDGTNLITTAQITLGDGTVTTPGDLEIENGFVSGATVGGGDSYAARHTGGFWGGSFGQGGYPRLDPDSGANISGGAGTDGLIYVVEYS